MARKQSIGDVELLVLLAFIRLGPEAYGVPIAREIEARAGEPWRSVAYMQRSNGSAKKVW
jgi:hypothetical protein